MSVFADEVLDALERWASTQAVVRGPTSCTVEATQGTALCELRRGADLVDVLIQDRETKPLREAFLKEARAVARRYGLVLDAALVHDDPAADVRMVRLRQPGDEPPPRMPGIAVGAQPPTQTGLREVNRPIPHPPEPSRDERLVHAVMEECARVAREWSKCDLNFSAGFRLNVDVAAVIAAVDQ